MIESRLEKTEPPKPDSIGQMLEKQGEMITICQKLLADLETSLTPVLFPYDHAKTGQAIAPLNESPFGMRIRQNNEQLAVLISDLQSLPTRLHTS